MAHILSTSPLNCRSLSRAKTTSCKMITGLSRQSEFPHSSHSPGQAIVVVSPLILYETTAGFFAQELGLPDVRHYRRVLGTHFRPTVARKLRGTVRSIKSARLWVWRVDEKMVD
jgi:hypothetical protein